MTDAQIIRGIKDNDSIVWRYICRNLKPPFVATLNRFCFNLVMLSDDWDDIFQESCMILMENIKQGKFVSRSESSLFNYFIEIGKRTMQTALRKKAKHQPVPAKREDTPHIIQLWPASAPNVVEEECEPISAEDSQKEQDRFLDKFTLAGTVIQGVPFPYLLQCRFPNVKRKFAFALIFVCGIRHNVKTPPIVA